jgi:hypothetical protein
MPEQQKPETQEQQEQPSSTPPGTGTGSAPAPTEPPKEFRFGADAPQWAQGKSANDVLGIAQQYVDAYERQQSYQPQQQQQEERYEAPQGQEEYVTNRSLQAAIAQAMKQVAPAIAQPTEAAASALYATIRRDPKFSEYFSKYEPEIQGVLSRVPRANWTLDTIETAVKFVRGNHIEELASERAQQLISKMEPTMRPSGVAGSAPKPTDEISLASDKLPASWRDHAKQVGLSEKEIQEFCWGQGISTAEFYKQFEGGKFVTDANADINVGRLR